jgi:putative two-component system response regulator
MSTADNPVNSSEVAGLSPASDPARVLVVDDEVIVREILCRKLRQLGYNCSAAPSGESGLALLSSAPYDLLLMDLTIPGMDGIALMREARRDCPDLAIILVTSVTDIETAVGALKDGAYDYITKPFSLEEVSISVARALEKRRLLIENRQYQRRLEEQITSRTRQLKETLEELQRTYHSTLLALGAALDSRDADSDRHSLRVTLYAVRLAKQMGVDAPTLRVIEQAALLHDIGKIGVPDALLRKATPLDNTEWVLMRKHPEIGWRILSGIKFLQDAARVVLQHHERFDGSGYPAGLKGEEIELGARVFAVADTMDCITSMRPYKPAETFERARDEIESSSGTQLDPKIVAAFRAVPLDEWRAIRRGATGKKRGGEEAADTGRGAAALYSLAGAVSGDRNGR